MTLSEPKKNTTQAWHHITLYNHFHHHYHNFLHQLFNSYYN